MIRSAVSTSLKHYITTTTLHGFKYLYSKYYVDRLSWLLCFFASTCCAGVLCAVLWKRFLAVPELLTLYGKVEKEPIDEKVPTVAICPTTESIAELFVDKLSSNKTKTQSIPKALDRLISGISFAKEEAGLLESLLLANNVTLPEVMMEHSLDCSAYIKKCRYQDWMVPCEQLFQKTLTIWGVCCVIDSEKLIDLPQTVIARSLVTQTLDLVLQCTHGHTLHGCQYLTWYDHEDNIDKDILLPGYYYRTTLRFIAIPEKQAEENLVGTPCISDKTYSRTICMLKCAEDWCGCSDPFHMSEYGDTSLPMCPVTRIECIRGSQYKLNITCQCLPPCKRITTAKMWESSQMYQFSYTVLDPIYSNLNVTSSIVLTLRVNVAHSRIFLLNPTETWLTLLSSLGGVFNMFLGVGVFSALEFLFFIFVKLPNAVKKSSEIQPGKRRNVLVDRY